MICVTGEGFHKVLVTRFMERRKQLTLAMKEAMKPQEPKTKNFIPKCPELPVLASYEGVFSEDIWKMWPSFKPPGRPGLTSSGTPQWWCTLTTRGWPGPGRQRIQDVNIHIL